MPDRELLEAKYTSPSGKEFTFLWEKVSKKTQLKTGIFTYPDKDGAHVQHQGGGPTAFPLQCIFNGEGHIKTADDFEAALLERDTAELQHPLYGIRKVIPTGDIQRDDDYVNILNETHVTVTFTETLTDEEPTKLEAVAADEIEKGFDEFSESAAADFAESITIETINEAIEIQATLNSEADIINDNLSGLVSSADYLSSDIGFDIPAIDSVTGKSKSADFVTSMQELKNNIKTFLNKTENLVQKSLDIARLKLNLMKMPSRMIINITEKIKGYSRLMAQIANQFKNDPYGANKIKNSFASTRLVLSGAIASVSSGAALGIANIAARRGALTLPGSGIIAAASPQGAGSGEKAKAADAAEAKAAEKAADAADAEAKSKAAAEAAAAATAEEKAEAEARAEEAKARAEAAKMAAAEAAAVAGEARLEAAVAGMTAGVESGPAVNGVLTREVAAAIAIQLKSTLQYIQDFENAKIKKNTFIDSNASSYLLMVQLINKSIQFILTSCLALPMKRTIKLDRDRNFIELCAELYGTVDDGYLDRLIIENNLNIDELEIIPMGREVTYYVESA